MKLAAAVVGTCAPALSLAIQIALVEWVIDTSPPDGLDEVTFPINMANSPHREGYYFAQAFRFQNVNEIGYTGLQPRPDSDGRSIIHAAFSSFQNGTTTSHSQCYDGADGGPGVSCALEIDGDYSHTYNLVVRNIRGDTWRGTLVDAVTGERHVIGQWTLPPGSGKIGGTEVGFVEYYLSDVPPSVSCNDVPEAEVTFGIPTSGTGGAAYFSKWYEHEKWPCQGDDSGYEATNTASGLNVKVGFSRGTGDITGSDPASESQESSQASGEDTETAPQHETDAAEDVVVEREGRVCKMVCTAKG
ncbi:hypothetical protein CDD83_4298 [Cordyceps sp. RAO-2017]|nr:hypothetical protein CDD83_4298 [Cordyceps sp. RAO-2017]